MAEKTTTLPIDDTDRRLSELIMDIQYHCQHYFFGEYARAYYDNKERDAAANAGRKRSKTRVAYNALPESFTLEDIESCFSVSHGNAKVVATRLVKDKIVDRISTGKYKKIIQIL